MKLMIIESPGKIKKLSAILGTDWKIAASIGHVRDLPINETGVEAPEFRPCYELTERGAEVVGRLKTLVKEADSVYLATDPDREGESISWHLQQCLKLKNPYRVTFNEITANAVKTALISPRSIDVKLVAAQEARRVLDRLVGYKVSPEISLYAEQRLSAGRVQSPAVRLVVERERAIRAFKVTKHFGAMIHFADAKSGNEWSAEWVTKPDFVTEDNPYFMDRAFAAAVAEVKAVIVKLFDESETKRNPPPPFITSTMQRAASVALGLDPASAMEAAQKLYEQGHITYHRTDNPNVSEDSLADIYAVAVKLGLDMADKPRKFKAAAGAQAGHPAITPTHWEVEEAGETDAQRALYKMIRIRAIACQLASARYSVRTVQLLAEQPIAGKNVAFEAKGRTLVYQGWLKLLSGDQTEEEGNDKETSNPIPFCEPGERIETMRGNLLDKRTNPPGRYTLASLIEKLEREGIGRPATYAAILENIVKRSYIKVTDKALVPTATGELIVDALAGKFEFIDLAFTRDVEVDLDRIANGEATYKNVITKMNNTLEQELATLQVSEVPKHPCPDCGKPLRRIEGKRGYFWGCSGHPICTAILTDEQGEPGKKIVQEVSSFACAKCGKPLIHRVKEASTKGERGYDFWGCSGFRDGCKTAYENKDGKPQYVETK